MVFHYIDCPSCKLIGCLVSFGTVDFKSFLLESILCFDVFQLDNARKHGSFVGSAGEIT